MLHELLSHALELHYRHPDDVADLDEVVRTVRVREEVHGRPDRFVDGCSAQRRIQASAAEVRLAEAGRPVRPVALQNLQALAQDGVAALEPGGRDDGQVVQ